jgi:membrane protein
MTGNASPSQNAGAFRSTLRVLRTAWRNYESDYARYFAVGIVYYALMSLIPLLLLVLAGVGLLLRYSDVAVSVEQRLLSTVEVSLGEPLRGTIEDSLGWLQQESSLATVISVAGLLLTSSALFRHLRMTFRAIWKLAPPLVSGPWRVIVWQSLLEWLVAFLIVLGGGLLLLLVLGLITMAEWLNGQLAVLSFLNATGGWLAALAATLLALFCVFALLFSVLPPVRLRFRHVWLASLLCAAGWLLGSEVLALYGGYFSKNIGAYGALAGVLVLMLWMKFMSQALFFGAEICRVVHCSVP